MTMHGLANFKFKKSDAVSKME